MPEIINPEPESRTTSFAKDDRDDDHIAPDTTDMLAAREGLPRGYRMRADQHYVDQLSGQSAGQPVRMVPLAQIDSDESASRADLRPLIESIRTHGIVHPLLLRRHQSRYKVVAGRKRLIVAQMLRLASVPSLIHEVTDSAASALDAADNVRVGSAAGRERSSVVASALRLLTTHVSTVLGCANLQEHTAGLNRPALDLLKTHAWRASRLVAALDLIGHEPMPVQRERSLASLIDDVIDGFGPECRLSGLTICSEMIDAPSSSGINGAQLGSGLAGALLATIPLVERVAHPTICIRTQNRGTGRLTIELTQGDAPVSQSIVDRFFDVDSVDRPGGPAAAIGALAAQALADAYAGESKFEATDSGSRLTIGMTRRT